MRASMYKLAQDHTAHYFFDGIDASIFYKEGSNDLTVQLLFESRPDAHGFQTAIANTQLIHASLKDKLTFSETVEEVEAPANFCPCRVFLIHYKTKDSAESPTFSYHLNLGDLKSESTEEFGVDPRKALQSVEDLSFFPKVNCYACHLIPRTVAKHKKDPSNVIYESWLFHQYFDGLNTTEKHGIPMLAIRYDSAEAIADIYVGEEYGTEKLSKVHVTVILRDLALVKPVMAILRSGSSMDVANPLHMKSFLYAPDPVMMGYFLNAKCSATLASWKELVMEDTEVEEMCESRS
jgi:hypothetical protein